MSFVQFVRSKGRIIISGPGMERVGGRLLGVPGARRARNKHNVITIPISSISVWRAWNTCKKNDIQTDMSEDVKSIFSEVQGLKDAAKIKKADGQSDGGHVPCIPGIRLPLWDHQSTAIRFLQSAKHGYLAMDMGTGKTIAALGYYATAGFGKCLVVCPKSVIEVWEEEIKTSFDWPNIEVLALKDGNSKEKAEAIKRAVALTGVTKKDLVVVINYESARIRTIEEILIGQRWDCIIADEAHKIKSASSATSKLFSKLSVQGDIRVCLSGTPLPNSKLDVYGQYRFLDPGIFGTNSAVFKARYALMGGYENREVIGWQNQDEYNRLINCRMYRVSIDDVISLPEPVTKHVYCEMGPKATRVYKDLKEEFAAYLESGEVTVNNTLAKLMKFRQLASGFIINDDGEVVELDVNKIEALEEVMEEIPPGEKVVIFCDFKRDIEAIRRSCENRGLEVGIVSGDQKDTERGKFPPGKDVLICQAQAGGLGLNLVASRYCIFYSVSYNLADYLQARARVYRGGQDRTVVYTHIVCNNGIDKRVYQALRTKQDAVELVMDFVKHGG